MRRTNPATLRATGLSLGDTLLRQVLQFGFSIFLARLLAPEEFGVLAMLYVFIGLASALSEGGLGAALIQNQDSNPAQESSVFQFNAAAGLAMTLLLFASAPAIERFYDYPGLAAITMAMALNVFINALGAIHGALVIRELRIGLQLRIGVISSTVSGVVAVVMAWQGHGVWSLVVQTLLASTLTTALLWAWHGWRPRHAFSIAALRPLLRYGSALMLSGLLDLVVGRLYTVLIGRFYGAAPLGLYMRAVTTQNLPQMMVGAVMRQVAFPVLAASRADLAEVRRSSRLALRASMLLQTPCLLGIAATAESLVPLLFGRGWMPSVPILQVLCIAGCLYPISHVNLTVLKALGRSGIFLRLEAMKKGAALALLLAAAPFGLLAIAWSQVCSALLAVLWNASHADRLVGYGLGTQARDAAPSLALAAGMAIVVWETGRHLDLPNATTLAIQVPLGIGIYVAGCFLFRMARIDDLRHYLKSLAGPTAVTIDDNG